jgi:hypothetical protein
MAAVDEETAMIDFRDKFVETLRAGDDGFEDRPKPGQAKVFRPKGCFVYRVDPGQEEEFRRWVAHNFQRAEMGEIEVRGKFPMLRIISPFY